MPELKMFRKRRKSLICFEIAASREICEIRVSLCYCQPFSRLLVSLHANQLRFGVAILGETTEVRMRQGPMRNRVRFRVCGFVVAASSDSFQEVPRRHCGQLQPICSV